MYIRALMGVKIVFLAAIGVAALYMIHLLAQDYNKIRKQPAAAIARAFFSKRDLSSGNHTIRKVEEIDFEVDWDRILKRDPLECAQSFICQISSDQKSIESNKERSSETAKEILSLVQYSIDRNAPVKITKAYSLGVKYSNTSSKCYKHFPLCPYSSKTMLKLIQLYNSLFG